MAESFIWSILILTIPQRGAMLRRLLEVLRPQIMAHPEQVELCIRRADVSLPVGENREAMRQKSRGEYISFIDDDDMVAPNFVERILPLLLHPDGDGVDYVGFNLEQIIDGKFACIERRSLRYRCRQGQGDGQGGRLRDLSHLNPMRRELALRVPMSGWPGEDNRWTDAIRRLNIVKTEHYLDEILYYYLTRTEKPELLSGAPAIPIEPLWRFMSKIKVKMLTGIAGLPNPDFDLPEHSYAPEQIVELHPKLAEAWIAGGIAEPAKEPAVKDPKSKAETPAPAAPPAAKVVPIAGGDKVFGGFDLAEKVEVPVPAKADAETPAPAPDSADKTASKPAKKSAKE